MPEVFLGGKLAERLTDNVAYNISANARRPNSIDWLTTKNANVFYGDHLIPDILKINKPPVKLRACDFYLLLRRDSNPQPNTNIYGA